MTAPTRHPALLALALAACQPAPTTPRPPAPAAPADPAAPAASADDPVAAPLPTPSASSPAATPTPQGAPSLRATTAMRVEGVIQPKLLVDEINRQTDSISRCAELIRATDTVVGSLNVQVSVQSSGVTYDLQSPVNPEAKRCLLDGMSRWSLIAAGTGRAMVLLSIEHAEPPAPTPPPTGQSCDQDADCVLTTFPGCCSCCPCAPLRAKRADVDARDREMCAVVDCRPCVDVKVKCHACQDPAKEGMRARCIDRTCTLVETRR